MLEAIVATAATKLPLDVYEALLRAYREETEPLAKKQLEAMIRNAVMAAEKGAPLCQDTGVPVFYMRVGADYPYRGRVYEAAVEALRRATRRVPLRPNTVDPLGGGNPGDNTGRYMPWVEVEIVEGDRVEATYVPKGGGSEAATRLVMATPLEGRRRLYEAVLTAVADAGPKPCPPFVIGVAVAATGDIALSLAKRAALLRPLGSRHPDPRVAAIEEELLGLVNELGLGPHGFGGKTTALDLHMEYSYRHPATYAIGVVFSCWALRRATGVAEPGGEWRITSRHLGLEG